MRRERRLQKHTQRGAPLKERALDEQPQGAVWALSKPEEIPTQAFLARPLGHEMAIYLEATWDVHGGSVT
jgi:hypothetical protein